MPRSVWKGPFVDPSLLKKVEKIKSQSKPMPITNPRKNGANKNLPLKIIFSKLFVVFFRIESSDF